MLATFQGCHPAMHNHLSRVEMQIGQVEGDNPEEVKKQKAIKGLLNKITPEKFDKILADIIAVGYEAEATESGLIDQVRFSCCHAFLWLSF